MRVFVASVALLCSLAASAGAQVFYPQPLVPAPIYGAAPSYGTADNLDVTVEVEGFTTIWGEGFSGVSYGMGAELDLSPSISLELDAKRLDTNLGSAYEYGAGINVHGPQGELYAAINSIATRPDGMAMRDQTWVEVGGEFAVTDQLSFGFEASTTLDGALVPYDAIHTSNTLHQYR